MQQLKLNLSDQGTQVSPLILPTTTPLLLPLQGQGIPVFLSYGLGWDSLCLGLMLLFEPELRNFALEDWVWITGMTGKEWAHTRWLNETYIIPLLRNHGVRYIQGCRQGKHNKDGIVILSDSLVANKCGWTSA